MRLGGRTAVPNPQMSWQPSEMVRMLAQLLLDTAAWPCTGAVLLFLEEMWISRWLLGALKGSIASLQADIYHAA